MILISEVASLGRDLERTGNRYNSPKLEKSLSVYDLDEVRSVDENSVGQRPTLGRPTSIGRADRSTSIGNVDKVIEEGHRNKFTGTLSPSQRIKIAQLLDHWEEPETFQKRDVSAIKCTSWTHITVGSNSFFFNTDWGIN